MIGTELGLDQQIHDAAVTELEWDPKTPKDIAVRVKDGVVTLCGFVPSYWEKSEAEEAVKRIHGVKAVANDLKVKLTSERTDPEIARGADQALQADGGTPQADLPGEGREIIATIRSGWETARGVIESPTGRRLGKSETREIRRQHMVIVGQPGHQFAKHMRRSRESLQQEDNRRCRVAVSVNLSPHR